MTADEADAFADALHDIATAAEGMAKALRELSDVIDEATLSTDDLRHTIEGLLDED